MPVDTLEIMDSIDQLADKLSPAVLLRAVLTLVIGAVAVRFLIWLLDKGMKTFGIEKGFRTFFHSVAKFALWCLVLILAAGTLGFDPSSLVTLLGVLGLAISLAVQGSLSNIAGGFTIMATKPFVVGDFIEITGTVGLVREIGLIHTMMDTTDSKVVFLPNSQVASAKIINYSRHKQRRIELSFKAAAEADPVAVRAAILKGVANVPDVLREPEPFAGVASFGEKSTEFALRVWVDNHHYRTVTHDLQEAVRAAFVEEGIKLAP